MSKVFVDTSVLFAAIYSQRGAARDLLLLAIGEQAALYISQLVLEETERNLAQKAPEKLDTYRALLHAVPFTVAPEPSKEAVLAAAAYTALKDAPLIAAALSVHPDYFVTYDRKDLLEKPEVAEKSGLTIVTPDVVVSRLRGEDPEQQVN